MSTWSSEDLDRIGAADELRVAPRRPDGTQEHDTPIWVVRVGDDLYVRSYRGPRGSWYRRAQRTHEGRLRANGKEHDVAFEDAPDESQAAVDRAYGAKYGRSSYVDAMVTDDAATTTMRLVPR